MDYEDIEPPTPDVDRLYRDIVANYKAGKYSSQEEALSILEYQYYFSFIDIKNELQEEFDAHPFYVYGAMGSLDEYIKVCEKSINSPTITEKEIYAKILEGLIRKVQAFAEKTDNLKYLQSYDDTAKCVYRQTEKIWKLSRKNEESKKAYEKYRAEIEGVHTVNKNQQIGDLSQSNYQNNFFMQILKNDAKQAFECMKKAIQNGLVEYKNNYFNFKCDKGCVGLFFSEAGYTDYKRASQHILINDEQCNAQTLSNGVKQGKTKGWDNISKIIFGEIK